MNDVARYVSQSAATPAANPATDRPAPQALRSLKTRYPENDPTTRGLLEGILADEEDHLKTFTDMIGGDVLGGELLDPKLAQ